MRLTAGDREALLVDWLNHLLYLFDVDGFLGRDFQVESLTPERLKARVTGESFDPDRHPRGAHHGQGRDLPSAEHRAGGGWLAGHGGAGFVIIFPERQAAGVGGLTTGH